MKIRSKILFLQLYRKFKGKAKKSSLTPFKESKSFAIVINQSINEVEQKQINLFTQKLREEGKSVETINIYQKKKPLETENSSNNFKIYNFDKTDFSATGLPNSTTLKDFLKTDYHYLIFCNPKNLSKNAAIAGFTSSLCVIGPYSEKKTPGYDFIVNNTENMQSYFESIYNTLNQIR